MFNSKQILDALIQGAAQGRGGGLGGGLGGLLGSVLNGQQQRTGAGPQGGQGGIGDLLGSLMGGAGAAGAGGAGAGGLGGLLGGLMGGAQGGQQPGAQGQPGGLGDILGSLFGQATGGAKDAYRDVNQATGMDDKISRAIEQATGKRPSPDMLQQIQDYIAANPGMAAATAGGLGSLVLGSKGGRSLATSAVKLGGLALIGGLAYRAYQNYLNGKAPVQLGSDVAPPPAASAFHEDAGDPNQNALLMLRGMIAAAAADGTIDEAEKKAIMGNVQALGMDREVIQFLNNEVASPADPSTLANEVQGPEQATALYTACLLAIDVNNRQERRFMDELAEALGLDEQLVAQIEASTESVKQPA